MKPSCIKNVGSIPNYFGFYIIYCFKDTDGNYKPQIFTICIKKNIYICSVALVYVHKKVRRNIFQLNFSIPFVQLLLTDYFFSSTKLSNGE